MTIKICKSKLSALALSLGICQMAYGEVAVICHPDVNIEGISRNEVSRIYLAKDRRLPDGTPISPIDQAEGESPRDEFYSKVVRKDASQVKAYRSKLLFSGKAQPPKVVGNDGEVIGLIAANPNLIGYVDSASLDDSVRVLLLIP